MKRPTTCAVCGAEGARPAEGHRFPFCRDCEQDWIHSGERARAATALGDFVRRRKLEIAQESALAQRDET